MVSNMQGRWAVAATTFAVWALVAASCVYWGLKLTGSRQPVSAPAPVRGPAPVDPGAVARLMGFSPALPTSVMAPSLASRFVLQGVVAGGSHAGAALIAVDGKPPKPFRVGASVGEGLVLQSVAPRKAVLAASQEGPVAVTLELPLRR